jgi:uncharacterized protein YfaS (alpha-2-macroglobulin family)
MRYYGVGDPPIALEDLLDAAPYWAPLVIADPDGRAHVGFRLPDVETTFRLTVDAHGAGRIGSREAEIISRNTER